jgi:hypothetical protein
MTRKQPRSSALKLRTESHVESMFTLLSPLGTDARIYVLCSCDHRAGLQCCRTLKKVVHRYKFAFYWFEADTLGLSRFLTSPVTVRECVTDDCSVGATIIVVNKKLKA